MTLLMYIENELIDMVPLQDERISIPGYLGEFKRQLKQKHQELILQNSSPPQFFVSGHLNPMQVKKETSLSNSL